MATLNHPIAGRVEYTRLSGGRLKLDPSWVERNIGVVHIPQLKGVPTYGGKFSGNVMWYKRGHGQLQRAWDAVEKAGVLGEVIFWDGSWVPRLKRGGNTPSEHTVATAFDINAEWNGFRQRPARKGEKGYLGGVVAVMRDHGFECGYDWKNSPDGMHFQIKRLMSDIVPTAPIVPDAPKEPVKVLLNDVLLEGAKIVDGRLVVEAREVLDALGYVIERVGDHRKEKNRFYVYAVRKDGK